MFLPGGEMVRLVEESALTFHRLACGYVPPDDVKRLETDNVMRHAFQKINTTWRPAKTIPLTESSDGTTQQAEA